jgi:hypothetical protein
MTAQVDGGVNPLPGYVIFAVLIIVLFILLFYLRRRERRSNPQGPTGPGDPAARKVVNFLASKKFGIVSGSVFRDSIDRESSTAALRLDSSGPLKSFAGFPVTTAIASP